ncbi:unnamed protein product, partial [Choristocarpus tenellus]
MGKDYYKALGVDRKADETAIKKAYRKAALKWHPDKNKAEDAPKKFQEISEAFEVLSDPAKRRAYDQFGEAGLGGGADDSAPGAPGGFSGFPGFAGFQTTGGTTFHSSDPLDLFHSMFGTMDVDEAMSGGGVFGDSPFVGGMGGLGGMMGMMGNMGGGRGTGGMRTGITRQAPSVEHVLNLSLEELYTGSTKRMRITKKTALGADAQVDKSIAIKPGWKDGTRITFAREGDELP